MRAFVVAGPKRFALREIPNPVVVESEVLVRPLLVGVCGTDLELVDGTIDPAYVHYPLVLGHEWVGQLASDVDGVGPEGSTVVVEGIIPCGECAQCVVGASNLCGTYDEIGFTRAGAVAESVAVPRLLAHRLGDDVDVDDAVFIEPMAVVWRALARIPLREGLRVAVVGDGTVALLATHMIGLFHPASVTVVGRRIAQRELALRAGADTFVTETPSENFDLVIEAAGNVDAVTTAIGLCARGAMAILLGLPAHGSTVEIAPDDLVNDDLIIQGSFSYTRAAFADVVARVNRGDLKPSFLITHRFSLEDASRAIEALRGVPDGESRGKVIIDIATR
jgi:L-iditol 2-dehydrogenase